MKKWNWSIFWIIIIVSSIGILSNKTVETFGEGILAILVTGVPIGLLWAYIARKKE